MAGIYFHIPYCKQACHYCDFHFSTNRKTQHELIACLGRELELRAAELKNQPVETIYFGGGTPSLLEADELNQLLTTVSNHFQLSSQLEITLEGNPDDLTPQRLGDYWELGVNRLSVGIQTFQDSLLQFLNRAHTSAQAHSCIEQAKQIGFDDISVDLIYGIHGSDHHSFEKDVRNILDLGVPHISAYCLTIEEPTAFGKWQRAGKISEVDDQLAVEQYEVLKTALRSADYEQYEISNFAKNERFSRHNTNYWKQKHFLGIGPGAHSFNGNQRSYNIANNQKYIHSIQCNTLPKTSETLTKRDRINEYFLTSLRTKWGTDLLYLKEALNYSFNAAQSAYIYETQKKGWITIAENTMTLTESGKLFADEITLNLFIPSDD